MRYLLVPLTLALFGLTLSCGGQRSGRDMISVVKTPPTAKANSFYVSNRAPLLPSPLAKLPIGATEPRGWLLGQLRLMRDGLTGRLKELSRFLGPESGWITLKGRGWEEMPYWLKGFGDLAYILKDPEMIAEAKRWVDYALASQQPDGFFGPPDNREHLDLWPNMVMLYALQSLYEATGDGRVIPFMTKYFRFESSLPDEKLLPGSWQKLRGGDNLESVYWLYNRTGDAFLLDLGRRLYERTADWTSPILSPERDKNWVESSFYHGVNIAMGFRQPGVYYQQSKAPAHLAAVERNLRQVLDEYGQQPGGTFGADENIRPGKTDPRQGTETCTIVEFMASFETLLRIAGDAAWADRAEEMAFNALPAAMTPDLKGLHYLTAPNLISCDASGEHDFQNSGALVSYDPWSYRCCQHNVAFGWPYFAENLWLATPDNGLAAVIYAPNVVQAKVGSGAEVRISEETAYPFGGTVEFALETPGDVDFPLYLRLPGWSQEAKLSVNGREAGAFKAAGSYVRVERTWKNGDRVRLELPQSIRIKTWPKVGNSVSVARGPLWYSLRIGERWNRYGGTDAWPAYEILPTAGWNYGLRIDPSHPEASITVAEEKAPGDQPFTPEAAPIRLTAKARRVPAWREEGRMVGPVPPSPADGEGEVVEVELIPLGCARLRVAQFPVVKD